MNIPKISIIVPAYNIANYLPNCLDSLLHQTLREIEVIVVNDASIDGTQSVIDGYCAQDVRVSSVLNEKNKGPFLSRLEGIKRTSGEYVTFVDGDDYLEAAAYETMYDKAFSGQFDIVACGINRVVNGITQESFLQHSIVNETVRGPDILKNLLLERISNSVWNKLYTRELIDTVVSDDLFVKMRENLEKHEIKVLIEDQLFNFFAAFYATTYFMVEEAFYNYIFWENSLTTTKNERIMLEWTKSALHNFYIMEEQLKNAGTYSEFITEMEEMKFRLIVQRNRKILSLFDHSVRYSDDRYAKIVEDLTRYTSKEYLVKHIIDAAQLEISQLKKEKSELLLQKKTLKEENRRILQRIDKIADILLIPKKIVAKIKNSL